MTVSVVLMQTFQVAKARQLAYLTWKGLYESNDMNTCVDTCYAVANWNQVSVSNEVCEV